MLKSKKKLNGNKKFLIQDHWKHKFEVPIKKSKAVKGLGKDFDTDKDMKFY